MRAATGLAQTYLRSHDRVGLVTFGGPLHWLVPATGPRQLYRVSEALMSVRRVQTDLDAGVVEYSIGHLPRGLLPRRAFVALLSPLLDDGPLEAVRHMRERGFSPLVIDVLNAEPEVPRRAPAAALAVRTWRLQRRGAARRAGERRRAGARLGRRRRADRWPAARDAGRPAAGGAMSAPRSAARCCSTSAGRCAVVLAGSAAAAVAVPPDPSRPVLVMAGATVLACVAAAVLRWRLVGTLAVLVTTAAVLLAGALDDDSTVRPLQTLAAAALVVALVAALGGSRGGRRPARPTPWSWRAGPGGGASAYRCSRSAQVPLSPSRRPRTSYPQFRWSSPAWRLP